MVLRRVLIIGSSGSGKTWSLFSLFKRMDEPSEVVFFSHTLKGQVPIYIKAVKQSWKDKDISIDLSDEIPDGSMLYDTENTDELKKRPKHTIFVFDDVNIKEMERKLIPFFTISRHYNLSVILIYQRYFDIPLTIRLNSNLLYIFRSPNGYNQLYQDVKQFFDNNKKKFDSIMNLLNKKEYKHKFIAIDYEAYDEDIIQIKADKGFITPFKK